MKVFISQIMRDKTDEQILRERERLITDLNKIYTNVEVIDSFIKCDETNSIKMLAKAINLLADADIAVFGDGWEYGRGTVVEHAVCVAYSIPILTVKDIEVMK